MTQITREQRARALAELGRTVWAIKPDALAVVRGCVAGAISIEEAQAELRADPAPDAGRPAIAIVGLYGLITPNGTLFQQLFGGGGGLQAFRAAFAAAVNDPAVAAIVIDIDSPGGSSALVAEAAQDVYDARGSKPIVAIANTMAASAAYWIGSQADELVVTPSGEAGSIGVYTLHEDWSGFDEQMGIKTTMVKAGKYKAEANPWEPLSDEAAAQLQAEVDLIYDDFCAAVARARGTDAKTVADGFGEGRCLLARPALEANLVDGIEPLESVIARLAVPEIQQRAATVRHATFSARVCSEEIPPEQRSASAAAGGGGPIAIVDGSASVFGSRNSFGEVFVPGAFHDFLNELGANPLPMLDQHRQAVGSWKEQREDLSELWLKGPISDTQAGRDVATLLRDEAINGLSIAYLPIELYLAEPGEPVTLQTPYGSWTHTEDRWTFYVTKARLAEVSIVHTPSDPKARVGGISADQVGMALPGLRADAPWGDVAWSMCRLMGAPGAGLTELGQLERRAIYARLTAGYQRHDHQAPAFAGAPQYQDIDFTAGERDVYSDRSLSKRLADVIAAARGALHRPLSEETKARAHEAHEVLAELLQPGETSTLDDTAQAELVARLERLTTTITSS